MYRIIQKSKTLGNFRYRNHYFIEKRFLGIWFDVFSLNGYCGFDNLQRAQDVLELHKIKKSKSKVVWMD